MATQSSFLPGGGALRCLTVFVLAVAGIATAPSLASAALIDQWLADDLNILNDGDAIGSWSSISNRTVTAGAGLQPILKKNTTPGGGSVVRFNRHWMTTANSPFGGATAFSIAIVFKAGAAGANDAAQWYGKSGIVDAEQGGVTADWGAVIDEQGRVAIGSGSPDITTFSAPPSLVDSNFHAAVFTWGAGTQRVHVDNRPVVTQSGVASAARNSAGFSFGGIHTGEGGANRRFVGDIAEIRFYNTALSATEASNVIVQLTDTHIIANRPVIRFFTASTNVVLLSNSVTLSWNVTNSTGISIDNGIGPVSGPAGSVEVFPMMTTTYTLTATNALGSRSAQVTVMVDPGVPIANSMSVTTLQNVAFAVTLTGFDPNGGTLSYAIVSNPQHGTLSGTPPDLTCTPMPNFFGNDAFTFKVNDGTYDSPAATVFVRVNAPPTPPSAIVLSSTNIADNTGPGAFVAGLHSIDVNPEETQTYMLVPGFGDNALFAINGDQLLTGPGFAGGLGATFSVRIRDTDSGGLSLEQTFTLRVVEVRGSVVINELHYNGADNTVREEFVELHNATGGSVDLSFWRISGGIDYNFASGTTIPAGGFLIIAQHPDTILSRFGKTALGPWSGVLNNEGEEIRLRDANGAVIDEVDFRSEFPWPIAPDGTGASMQLINPALDNDLGSSWRGATPPTPGMTNVVFATNAAPNIRQVDHSPKTPRSTDQVMITCKVTDPEGVASVQLRYQLVAPGNFIPATLPLTTTQLNNLNTTPMTNAPNPVFEASTNWTTVAMTDDGLNGDEVAGDSIYTVILPQRAHRTLVRYRIVVTDSLGASRRAPFEDDPSLNFACFVYDGVPAYEGFSPTVLETLPVYTLITRDADLTQCTAWNNAGDQLPQTGAGGRNFGRFHFNWEGAVVYDGVVYDHVYYRLRGANGRYHNGKRSFRIRFNDGNHLEARDQSGNRFPTKWRELTTGKGQSNRGSETFALQEVINYFLWNKVGVPAPATFHFHFRVIRSVQETNRYTGDFWGMNWAQEKYDVRFLEAHDLPRGNLYKLVDNFVLGLDELRYQAPLAPTNAADFYNIENNLTGFQTTEWLLAHVNYTNWYRYHAVCEAIRHYDIWPSANKNGAWYFEPIYSAANNFLGRMVTLPYDSTDTWGPTWNNGDDVVWNGIFPSGSAGGDAGQNPELQKEYRNVVREMRDLLFQPDQIIPLIDAFGGRLRDVAQADHVRWSNAPAPASYVSLGIPSSPGVTGGLAGVVQDMKNFMFVGGNNAWWIDRNSVGAGGWITRLDQIANADTNIPAKPSITYVGAPGFPIDGLVFQSPAFADPQGSNTFGAIKWRIAEITPTNTLVFHPEERKLEWDAVWESGEVTNYDLFISVPAISVQPGKLYRARVAHRDNTGRWSRWSDPVVFTPTPADILGDLLTSLVISEIMYHPPTQGPTDGDEFEFLELKNTGTTTLNLSGLFFSAGINFTFTNGTRLAPAQTFLLARNPFAFQSKYPGVVVNGVYSGRLDNAGETLTIQHPNGTVILSITYADEVPWPLTPDGFGFSLVLVDPATERYRASSQTGGSPGADDPPSAIPGIVINEVLTSSTLPEVDAIELFNPAGADADIGGWYLTDDPAFPWKYRIPNGTVLNAESYVAFDESQFNPTPGAGTSFALSSFGDDVYLFSANTNFQLTGYSHGFNFGGAENGVSFGRYINSAGEEQFPAQLTPTPGGPNSGPRVGPVVFNEIQYHPALVGDEFIELRNITGNAVSLFDPANPTNRWRLAGLNYTFPAGLALGPNELLLLVATNPASFRAKYSVPPAVQIVGPFVGNLQDSGERLELQSPDAPTTNGVPYFAVDIVRYNDKAPWPSAADGLGPSLQRQIASAYGNDPTNWAAAIQTPGALFAGGAPPSITSQPANRVAVASRNATFHVNAIGPEPLYYQWRFNGDPIAGATNTTLLLTNVQPEQAGRYTVDIFNAAGSVLSGSATLAVLIPANITMQPEGFIVRPGTNVIFRVTAISRTPITYQWRFNGMDIPNATNSTFAINDVQEVNHGDYVVVVTDSVGSIDSAVAKLVVLISPTVLQQPQSQTVVAGDNVTFKIVVTGTQPIGFRWRREGIPFVPFPGSPVITVSNVPLSYHSNKFTVVITNAATPSQGMISSNAFLFVLADSDGDRMADEWEMANGLNHTNAMDGTNDLDGDTMINRDEFVAGTDPRDPQSYLKVDEISATGGATLRFVAISNKTYTVQYRNALGDSPWNWLADVVATATNRLETIIDTGAASGRYYRLVTPLQP